MSTTVVYRQTGGQTVVALYREAGAAGALSGRRARVRMFAQESGRAWARRKRLWSLAGS